MKKVSGSVTHKNNLGAFMVQSPIPDVPLPRWTIAGYEMIRPSMISDNPGCGSFPFDLT